MLKLSGTSKQLSSALSSSLLLPSSSYRLSASPPPETLQPPSPSIMKSSPPLLTSSPPVFRTTSPPVTDYTTFSIIDSVHSPRHIQYSHP
ncbi:hypothetical protein PF003_g24657 [Phytophthora fragariae]|nr:hypothetical protein PF003_g24657 [Phytophthora fragariae]